MNKFTESLQLASECVEEWTQEWLIQKLIPEGEGVILYAPKGSYKTFIAVLLGLLIANGRNSLGECKQKKVMYITLENNHGFPRRVEALQTLDLSEENFFISDAPLHILNTRDVKELMEAVREGDYGFVVIDTLSKALNGEDEAQATVAREIIDAVDFISKSTGATVMLVHHEGKKAYSGARGSSVITCDSPTVLRLKKNGLKGTLTIESSKSQNEKAKYDFVMQPFHETLYANFNANEIQSDLAITILKSINSEPITVSDISKNLFKSQTIVTTQDSFRRKVYREIDVLVGQGDLELVTDIKPKSVRRKDATH